MKLKYYVVKKGVHPGIYSKWSLCEEQVKGFSGAIFKSFDTYDKAKEYFEDVEKLKINPNTYDAIAYVDGSCSNDQTDTSFAYGVLIFWNGHEYEISKRVNYSKIYSPLRNVAGEIRAAMRAIEFAMDNKIRSLLIYHDYEGIAQWPLQNWECKNEGTRAYFNYYKASRKFVQVGFQKVKGHSGDEYNDRVDALAKEALKNESKFTS